MIHKTTDDGIILLKENLKKSEKLQKTILDSRDLALHGIHISCVKNKLDSSYTESTPLWEVQSMINKEIEPLHDKALSITKELCRIYREVEFRNIECHDCPLSIIGGDGYDDKCFSALKRHLVCQYLTTQFHV